MAQDVCPFCHGTGWKIVEHQEVSGAERCDCLMGDRAKRIEENSGIPPLYRKASMENFALPRDNAIAHRELAEVLLLVKSFMREFPNDKRPGLLLMGDPGTGKTHLAVAAMRGLMARGHEGIFSTIKICWIAFAPASIRSRDRATKRPTASLSTRKSFCLTTSAHTG